MDPIAGQAIHQGTAAVQDSVAREGANQTTGQRSFASVHQENLDAAGDVKTTLLSSHEARVESISATERAEIQREFEVRVEPMEPEQKSTYYARRIQESRDAIDGLESLATGIQDGPWRGKMMERLEDYNAEYGRLEVFLKDFNAGQQFSQQELLAIQIRMHQITESVELLSKAVEQSVAGMKTLFQTHV